MCLVKGSKIDKDWKTAKNHHLPFNRQKFLKKSKNIVESLKNVVPFFCFQTLYFRKKCTDRATDLFESYNDIG